MKYTHTDPTKRISFAPKGPCPDCGADLWTRSDHSESVGTLDGQTFTHHVHTKW